jgi:hypothetical protein
MAVKVLVKKSIEVKMDIWREIQGTPFDCNLAGYLEEIMAKEEIHDEHFLVPLFLCVHCLAFHFLLWDNFIVM